MINELPDEIEDVELVTFQNEHFEEDPVTNAGEFTGVPNSSLWIRFGDSEFPLYQHSEYGCWNSPMADYSRNVDENTVSEHFIEGVARLPSEDHGGWTGFEVEVWEEMSKLEQWIAHQVRVSLNEPKGSVDPRLIVLRICREMKGLE